MFHQYNDDEGLDTPKQLEALYDLGVPLIPLFLIGGASAGAAVSSWLHDDDWSVGKYNAMMRKINDTIHEWDKQAGGKNWNKCWGKHPTMRRQWKNFWSRWAAHYGEYGQIGECFDFKKKYTCFVPDSAEKPVRDIFLPELEAWGKRLNKVCSIETTPVGPVAPSPTPNGGGGSTPTGDIASAIKWGVMGIGAVLAFNVFKMTRGPGPRY
jgi:hypothetical protein